MELEELLTLLHQDLVGHGTAKVLELVRIVHNVVLVSQHLMDNVQVLLEFIQVSQVHVRKESLLKLLTLLSNGVGAVIVQLEVVTLLVLRLEDVILDVVAVEPVTLEQLEQVVIVQVHYVQVEFRFQVARLFVVHRRQPTQDVHQHLQVDHLVVALVVSQMVLFVEDTQHRVGIINVQAVVMHQYLVALRFNVLVVQTITSGLLDVVVVQVVFIVELAEMQSVVLLIHVWTCKTIVKII